MDPDVVASDEPYLTSDEDEDEVGHEASPTETDELIDNATATTENGASGVRKRAGFRARGRSSSRPTYKIPPTKTHLRTRSDTSCMAPDIHLVDRRDLSPSEVVRAYLARADEKIDHVIERLVAGVQEQAAAKSTALVNAGSAVADRLVTLPPQLAHTLVDKADVLAHKAAEKSVAVVHAVGDKLKRWRTSPYHMLPEWMKDNEHLHKGHRPELQSAAECFKSIFRIHTETGNIWTHMIGFFAFLVVTIVFYVKPFCDNCREDIGVSEKLIFLCFFIGAMVCLLCSTLFHTMSAHSEWVSNVFSRLDYVGIAVLIVGSSLTWLYYGFYCEFYTKLTYMVAVSIMGVLTAIVTMWDRFNMPDYRPYRALLFVSLGLVSALPVIHFVALNGVRLSMTLGALPHMLSMGGLYILGALLYALRIPERWLPGKCDIWFHSHQIFHLLVIVAAFVHYHGVYEMARLRLQTGPSCPVSSAPV